MNPTSVGREAEGHVAQMLQEIGHKIVSINWRTRWCEIDIISRKDTCVYFTEVKYRSSELWGGGLDYITKKKLQQMQFAAEFWLAENKWKGDVILQAAEVDNTGKISLIEI